MRDILPIVVGNKGASVGFWSGGVDYGAGDIVVFNGILLVCFSGHTSSVSSFSTDLGNWRSLSNFAVLTYQPAHGIAAYTPVYLDTAASPNFIKSNAGARTTCASHVTLYVNTDYILAVSSGTYTMPGHGKTVGDYYATNSAGGVTTVVPTAYLINPVYSAIDSSSIRVLTSIDPAPFRSSQTPGNDWYTLVDAYTHDGLSTTTWDIYVGGYSWIRIDASGHDLTTNTTIKRVEFVYNADQNANKHVQQYAAVSTNPSASQTTTQNRFVLLGVAGTTVAQRNNVSQVFAYIGNLGGIRNGIINRSGTDGSNNDTLYCQAFSWNNTVDVVSYIRFYFDTNIAARLAVYAK